MSALKEYWGLGLSSREIAGWLGHSESHVVCPGLKFSTFKVRSVGRGLF